MGFGPGIHQPARLPKAREPVVYCQRVPAKSPEPELRIDRSLAWIGGVAFAVRTVWVLVFAKLPGGGIVSDPVLYHAYAQGISRGGGYVSFWGFPTSYYPPGYPFFLGALYWLVDTLGLERFTVTAVGLTQALMWAVAAIAVALTARWAFESRRAGIAAGLVLALWPNLISYAGAWLSESLFVCLVAVGVAALTFSARRRSADRQCAVALGIAAVCLAAATMVRPQILLGLPLVAAAWLYAGIGFRRTLTLTVAVAAAVAALAVPWAIRNEHVLGSAVMVSTNGGDNLCIGFHPGALGGFAVDEYCDTGEGRIDGPAAEVRRNSEARQLALDHIRSEPLSLPWLSLRKLFWTYRTDDDGLRGNESYGTDPLMGYPWRTVWVTITAIGYGAIMLAAIAGVALSWRRSWRTPRDPAVLALYGLTLAGAVVVPVAFFGDPRFKVGTTPLFAVFAGLAAATLWQRARRPAEGRTGSGSAEPEDQIETARG